MRPASSFGLGHGHGLDAGLHLGPGLRLAVALVLALLRLGPGLRLAVALGLALLRLGPGLRLAVALVLAVLGVALPPAIARAHSGGVSSSGCGCHGSGTVGIDVDTNQAVIVPGQTVTVTVTVSSPGAAEAGLFLAVDAGELGTIAGQGLAEVASGLTHGSPRPMSGGQAQVSLSWTAPGSPGAVRFAVWAVAANGNNSSSGDQWDDAVFDFVYGCGPQTYYRDFDGDGYGQTSQPLVHCTGQPPEGYAAQPDDCNDNRADSHPGAPEYCNQLDDDCDGETDEDALPVTLYPDADGDGYSGQDEVAGGETMLGCVPTEGWADRTGDCRPDEPTMFPGAEEVCNGFDDDCDTDVDERVRPQCGEGWCRRESINCDPAACTPGEPRDEECNFFDDDCDGLLDEDAACPEGMSCQAGECRVQDDPGDDGSGGPDTSDSVGDGSGTGPAQDEPAAGGCGCREPSGGGAPWLLLPASLALRRRAKRARGDR